MGIRIDKKWVVYESVSNIAIDPSVLGITEERMREFMEEHPMPDDPVYSELDFVVDVTQSQGMYTLSDNLQQETRDYIAELLNALM